MNLHGQRPEPWCLNGLADVQLAVDHISRSFPGIPICGIGVSLGAAQLRNYVNATSAFSQISACVCVDAPENWEETVWSLDRRQPLISSGLFKLIHRTMVTMCISATSAPQDDILHGGTMHIVREYLAPAHGFSASKCGASNYLRYCQPADPAGCCVPVLEMISHNDVLIDNHGVEKIKRLYLASPHIITCVTRWGTHVIRWQGWQFDCWISKAACEFLEAALSLKKSQFF